LVEYVLLSFLQSSTRYTVQIAIQYHILICVRIVNVLYTEHVSELNEIHHAFCDNIFNTIFQSSVAQYNLIFGFSISILMGRHPVWFISLHHCSRIKIQLTFTVLSCSYNVCMHQLICISIMFYVIDTHYD